MNSSGIAINSSRVIAVTPKVMRVTVSWIPAAEVTGYVAHGEW
jgi:hypothetical protein